MKFLIDFPKRNIHTEFPEGYEYQDPYDEPTSIKLLSNIKDVEESVYAYIEESQVNIICTKIFEQLTSQQRYMVM